MRHGLGIRAHSHPHTPLSILNPKSRCDPVSPSVDSAKGHDSRKAHELCTGLKAGEIAVFDMAYIDYALFTNQLPRTSPIRAHYEVQS